MATVAARSSTAASWHFSQGGKCSILFLVTLLANPASVCDRFDMHCADLITMDPEILGGTPVFKGTEVPVKALFKFLKENHTIEEFVACFPSVKRSMALLMLDQVRQRFD